MFSDLSLSRSRFTGCKGAPSETGCRLYPEAVDALLARENAVGEILFDLTDHLGSVRGWVEPDGTLIESLAYESFGLPVGGWTSESRFGFTGREWTGPSELWGMRARYENGAAGRFTSADPRGLAGDVSAYRYAGNAPTLLVDPLGLQASGGGNPPMQESGGEDQSGGGPPEIVKYVFDAVEKTLNAISVYHTGKEATPPGVGEAKGGLEVIAELGQLLDDRFFREIAERKGLCGGSHLVDECIRKLRQAARGDKEVTRKEACSCLKVLWDFVTRPEPLHPGTGMPGCELWQYLQERKALLEKMVNACRKAGYIR